MKGTQTDLLSRIKERFIYLKSIGRDFEIAFEFSKEERDQLDEYLIASNHPLAMQPGTQEHRICMIARELATGKK